MAQSAQSFARAVKTLEDARKLFAGQPWDANLTLLTASKPTILLDPAIFRDHSMAIVPERLPASTVARLSVSAMSLEMLAASRYGICFR